MKKTLIMIAVILILGGVGYYFSSKNNPASSENQSVSTSSPAPTDTSANQTEKPAYTFAEVSKHNASTDCWIAINDNVYDATSFIASGQHNPEIQKGCGTDATTIFNQNKKHSGSKPQSLLPTLLIGTLK